MKHKDYTFYVLEDDLEGEYLYTIYSPDGYHIETRGGLSEEQARQQALDIIKWHEGFSRMS